MIGYKSLWATTYIEKRVEHEQGRSKACIPETVALIKFVDALQGSTKQLYPERCPQEQQGCCWLYVEKYVFVVLSGACVPALEARVPAGTTA